MNDRPRPILYGNPGPAPASPSRTTKRTLLVGAPAYRMMVRAEHAMDLADFAVQATLGGYRVGMQYSHTSSLPNGRAQVLIAAMEHGVDALISVDSDMWCPAAILLRALHLAETAFQASDVAAVSLVALEDAGTPNVVLGAGALCDVSRLPLWSPFDCYVIGAGVTIYNVAWHVRQRAKSSHWPWSAYLMGYVARPDGGFEHRGEDEHFCIAVREAGGRVLGLRVPEVHHASFRVASADASPHTERL